MENENKIDNSCESNITQFMFTRGEELFKFRNKLKMTQIQFANALAPYFKKKTCTETWVRVQEKREILSPGIAVAAFRLQHELNKKAGRKA